MTIENLLSASALPYEAPDFNGYQDDEFLPAVEEGIKRARKNIEKIRNNPSAPSFENTIVALEAADEELSRVLSIYYNLYSAHTNDTLQALSQEIGPMTAAFSNDILLDGQLFDRVNLVYEQMDRLALSTEEKTLLETTWLGFVRNGAKLGEKDQTRLREIDGELSKLSPLFSKNVLDATNAFELVIEDEDDLAGLPESATEMAADDAAEHGYDGKWRFSLDMPSYIAFMSYADSREHREKMWRAYASRAMDGEHDNRDIVKKIISLRHERARLLGYDTHAAFVLERRMAKDTKTVMDFIDRTLEKALPKAKDDLKTLADFAKRQDDLEALKPWDIMYYSEKMKKDVFDFDAEQLRPYFELDKVLEGMFLHAQKLYNLDFKEAEDGKYSVYHPDVRVFEVWDRSDDSFKALYYLDFFPRPSKRAGAWMNVFRAQGLEDGEQKRPIVVNVCNFTKPTKTKPSLITHREAETIFHEFGHGLHAMLADVTYKSMSGPNGVLWDFVELPSQMNEQWLGEMETLETFAKHYETGEIIPQEMVDKIKETQTFMSGWQTLRQQSMSKLDMLLHSSDPAEIKDVVEFERKIMKEVELLPYEGGCLSTSFSHIFAGGYSAGYYSYMWAEVLDADAFEAFVEHGLYDAKTAEKFKTLLASGASEDPAVLYERFRGRKANEDALFRRKGLLEAEKAA